MSRYSKAFAVLAAFATVTLAPGAGAADKSVVGVWKLLSWQAQDAESGTVSQPFGEHPQGHLIYTAGGNMIVNITADGRKLLSGDRFTTPAEERALAFSTAIAYSGPYEITDEGITHHVEVATFQNWVGTKQFRYVTVSGDRTGDCEREKYARST